MQTRLKRRIALLLFAVLAFAQLGAAFAATCPMNGMAMDMPCDDCDTPLQNAHNDMPTLCATACALGEQPGAVAALADPPPIQRAVLVLKHMPSHERASRLEAPPSVSPPHRILVHSFLI
jgi:hypothetical protein